MMRVGLLSAMPPTRGMLVIALYGALGLAGILVSAWRGEPHVYEDDYEVPIPDAVIPRIAAQSTFQGLSVLRHFELAGAIPLNSAQAIADSRDKLRSLQILCAHGVPMPDTCFTKQPHGDDASLQLTVVDFTES